MSMTSYLQKKIIDDFLGLTAYTVPTTLYLSLHTASPTDTGSFASEVSTSGTAYVRQSISSNMSAAGAVTGISTNAVTVTFPTITAEYGTVTHIGISDAVTAGNMCLWGAVGEPQAKSVGEAYQFTPGQISIQFD